MRRALVTAVAVAPLLAAMASVAMAACPAAGTDTKTDGNIEIGSGCTVAPKANGNGVVLDSNNNVTVDAGGSISSVDTDNAVGILVNGGTATVTNLGAISLTSSFVPPTNTTNGIADGAFTLGTGRTGILVTGPTFTGSITNASGATITVDGDNSFGMSVETGVVGDISNGGAITLVGNQTVALNIAGAITGNVTTTGAITATGVNAQGLVTSAPVSGQVDIGAAISTTGYRATTAPTNLTTLSSLTPDQLLQGGSAVSIGGNVGQGVMVNAAITTGTGTSAVTTAAASVTTFGSAPALAIGGGNQSITIGNNTSDPFGLVVGGSVIADGVYEKKTSPNLPTQVNATAIQLGSDVAGVITDLSGGVHITGAVAAGALDAQATAILVGAGTKGGAIVNDNSVTASVTADVAGGFAADIVLASGANIGSIVNNGSMSAVVTDSVSTNSTAAVILDLSGNVSSIHNTGQIDASLVPTDNSFVLTGPTIAIDVANATSGVSITQTPSTQFQGKPAPQFTGSISGSTLTVTAVASGNLVVGETLYGPGIAAGTTISAAITGTGGTGTYALTTTQTVSSEAMSAAGALPSISGDVLLGAGTAAAPNLFDIETGTTKGALTEIATGKDGNGAPTTNRNLDITVNNATVDITKAELHQVTTLNVTSTGVLIAAIDPSFAIGAANPTPIFDTTIHTGGNITVSQTGGQDGTATFADGAQVGISLDALQSAPSAKYVFVQTSGAPGALSVGNLSQTLLTDAPFLYTATTSTDGTDLFVTIKLKSAQELGLNASGAAAFNAVFNALQNDSKLADAIIAPTTQYGFVTLYNQLLPDQGLGIFEALESATEKISDITGQTPDSGTRIAGGSAWLQEVNETVKRNDGDTIGSTDKVFGLVGGYEKMGAGGGALGVTLSYLNIQDAGVFQPIGGELVTQLLEAGGYYRRAWGGLRLSARAAGGYAWFNEHRQFTTTGVNEVSAGRWNGYFADAHAGAAYEAHFGRFYLRPELSADYLYLNEDAHSDTGAGPGFDISIDKRVSSRMSAAALMSFGAQFGHDAWFRPELFGGYREVIFGDLASTTAAFTGGMPFTLSPGDSKGGWITTGFALKGGTPLSYVAIVGEADFKNNEQRYDIYLSGRAMF